MVSLGHNELRCKTLSNKSTSQDIWNSNENLTENIKVLQSFADYILSIQVMDPRLNPIHILFFISGTYKYSLISFVSAI